MKIWFGGGKDLSPEQAKAIFAVTDDVWRGLWSKNLVFENVSPSVSRSKGKDVLVPCDLDDFRVP
jgi:hypothetical protein